MERRYLEIALDTEVMTTGYAASVIGVTRQMVLVLINRGRLRAAKVGAKWLVSADDARSYRDARTRGHLEGKR